ncbi:amino acid ABC transporter permease [Pseudomonas matsuisoli]|uniref:Amino acid ABC transporter n=1 Tax=Pseudomonas matsuisoli TaxID=1515666 RepID=A0A917V1N6_9PSED|nr:ABC transporter permease subunit [Pseudomonas matsuisoli]GGK09043.1 amino acid ABC transporter [Pseudomonas matsuisoli]
MIRDKVHARSSVLLMNVTRIRWQHVVGAAVLTVVALAATLILQSEPESPVATLVRWMPFILEGFGLNLVMSFLAMLLATLLGVPLGVAQVSRVYLVRTVAKGVTHLFRNTPWLVVLFTVMYVMPMTVDLGLTRVDISDWAKATLAFALPVMGNISEIVRGAIVSVPTGQWDSAQGLALTRRQTMTHIILPQCVKRSLPSWMNWYALLTLATPMAAILGVREAVGSAQAAMEAGGGRPDFLIPFYLFLLCLFFIYIYPIALLTKALEKKHAAS